MSIFQTALPYDPFAAPPLPGIRPLGDLPWLLRDEAHAAQMAERDRLLREKRDAVIAMDEAARPAAEELLEIVLADQFPDAITEAIRADGVTVSIDRADPMGTLNCLVQEDLCLMEKRGEEHVLTAAALCFPARWMLSEKFLRPLIRIHRPVDVYDDGIAKRVQRLFDGVQPGRPIWRFNRVDHADPTLHQPVSEYARHDHPGPDRPKPYLRSERQCILRLPRTRAVVFSIHTYVLDVTADAPAVSGASD